MQSELATLGRHRGHCCVIRLERAIPGDRGVLGDHFGSGVVKFGGHIKH
jgi:hypothetical protein